MSELGFASKVLHTEPHDKGMHSHVTPIFQTASFVFDSPDHGAALFAGKEQGHIYSRLGNPTVEAYETVVAALEEGVAGAAFGSGMGAVSASMLAFLKAGDSCLVGDTLYGCSVDLVQDHLPRLGIEVITIDPAAISDIEKNFKPTTKIIYLETPANPTNKISDIPAIAEFAHKHGAMVVVDNTFSSPYFQKPLKLGADIVVHSSTKYINGHSDVVGGVLVASTKDQMAKVLEWRKVTGGIMGPMDAFLSLRGLKTLPIRMEKIQKSALEVAQYLEKRPEVEKVLHPGLPSFPQHELASKIMTGYGGTFSFTMKGGFEAAKRLLEEVKFMTVCVSLGAIDTMIQHPASMTHACVPEHLMIKQGLTRNMIRISIGIEDTKDIIADFDQAFEAMKKAK